MTLHYISLLHSIPGGEYRLQPRENGNMYYAVKWLIAGPNSFLPNFPSQATLIS
jgi:hypothetical protein